MDDSPIGSIPFLVLNAIMNDDYRETVVRRTLGYRGDATEHSRQCLAEALHKAVRVKGYRSAAHARTPLLLGAVVGASYHSNELMGAILQVWIESHSQLLEAVRAFLSARGTTMVEISMQDGFTGDWTAVEMLETAETFRGKHPDFDEDDVALMLCCLTGQAPIPDEMAEVAPTFAIEELGKNTEGEESQEEVSTLKWDQWLDELRALPSDAAEWETVTPFIEDLQQLAQEKLHECNAARGIVEEALRQLMEQAAEELDYFGLADVAGWKAETVPFAEVTTWAEEIETFRGLLIQHREIRQRSASSLAEERRRRETLGELEERVIQTHAHLATMFMPPPFPEGPGLGDDRQPSEPEGKPPERESAEFVTEPPEDQVVPTTEAEPLKEVAVSEAAPQVAVEEIPAQDELLQPVERTEMPKGELVEEGAYHEELRLGELPAVVPPRSAVPVEPEISEEATADIRPQEIAEIIAPEAATTVEEEVTEAIDEQEVAATEVKAEPGPQPAPASSLPLCSSREVAIRLQTGVDDKDWHSLVWALVAEDDLPAAYWLTRSLAASERSTPLPSGLLAAAQGARWLSPDSDMYVYDLLELVQGCRVAPEPVQEMIGLAAALRPTLVAPHSGLVGWLDIRACEPIFHDLATNVREFADLGVTLRPEDLLGVAGAEQRKAALVEAAQAATRWLDEAPERRTKLIRASDVWRRFVKQDLQEILAPVSDNRQADLDKVRRRLDQWQQQGFVSNQIDQAYRELVGPKGRPISGSPRQQIVRRVEEACSIASRWCSLVEHEREIETRGKWLFEQIGSLRADLQVIIPQTEDALIRLGDPAQPASMAAAACCLRRALLQVRETLALPPQEDEPEPLPINSWASLQFGTESLHAAIIRRLLWLPELALTADGQPLESTLPLVPDALRDACAEERSLHDAMEGWLQKQDYRFTEWLLSALHDEADTVSLSARIQEAVAGSQVALRDSKDQTINAIEQAVVDGIITDERSEYSAAVEAVDPAETQDFASKYEALRSVREFLSAARQKRLAELRANWEALQERLAQSLTEPAKQEQARQFLQVALECGDTRVVEESLARLTETLDAGRELEVGLFARPEARDSLSEFREAESDIQEWLKDAQSLHQVATNIENGQTRAQIRFGTLPAKRRTEASEALFAWRRLKQQVPEAGGIPDFISTLLRYLGFSLELDKATPIEMKTSGTDWVHVQVRMSASLLARPIPQFGSQAYGCYDVICLWDRPGAATIAARLRDLQLSAQSVLVLFLGRLTLRQRGDLTRVSREQELALAVLDETLLIFLAQERDARLPAFLRCALPFAALNPYTPFQAGDVPPEMFYGREDMARELQRPAGSCLVFGGRQLGKSALLRHVARQFHYPDREQYSWVENLKLIYLPEAGKETDTIWRALRENFKENRLLSRQVRTDRPDEIARRIRRVMNEVTDRRVLVMFDEADEFLDADAADGFRQVIGLRELMLETERRFKVIFAGLHNVQRFQGIPNQPLAHFGAPLCVGPLEPDAAQQLVREPLEVLGYRFTETATVLRVLSYTNYHPGLIQLFCQELLNELYEQGGSSLPPHLVEQKIVETVYRKPQVRERIRERFDWTLALDMRYQAIAWTLIEDQMEVPDSYAHPYPSGDILRMVRGWWPQVFDDMSLDQLRGLLDEMCGLGVLVRNADGYYRLRSPNLVRLMGTAADIEDRLLELSDKQPPQPPDADNHHAPLDDAAQRYSSLTYSQERSLNPPGFGVGLVFASRAGGADSLAEAFRRFVPSDLPDDTQKVMEIPKSVIDARYLRDWLDTQMQTLSRQDRQVLYHRPGIGSPEDMASLVQEGLDFSRRRQSRDQWVRLLFIFEPRAAWKWLSLPQNLRTDLENRADAVTYPRPWNLVGVRQRLAQHDKMHSDEVCQEVLSATGGWHYLIEALFAHSRGKDDPRPFAREIEKELQDADSQLYQDLLHSLGLEVHDAVRRVLEFIVREAEHGITADFVTPEFVGGQPVLKPEECMHATEYLQRMACVELHGETLLVDNLVRSLMSEL